ncbi:hypothetical protein SLA2020_170370 [Shorea laevis]
MEGTSVLVSLSGLNRAQFCNIWREQSPMVSHDGLDKAQQLEGDPTIKGNYIGLAHLHSLHPLKAIFIFKCIAKAIG